jgi:ABC-type thiamin/hydroxymethylpyrimidine transport system permease subunit
MVYIVKDLYISELGRSHMTKTKWLIFTVLIGLIPFIMRSLVFLITNDLSPTYIINEIDLVAFGLVLNVSNISEMDGSTTVTAEWKLIRIGVSLVSVVLFAGFLMATYIAELPGTSVFNREAIRWGSVILTFASFLFSYSIFKRLV